MPRQGALVVRVTRVRCHGTRQTSLGEKTPRRDIHSRLFTSDQKSIRVHFSQFILIRRQQIQPHATHERRQRPVLRTLGFRLREGHPPVYQSQSLFSSESLALWVLPSVSLGVTQWLFDQTPNTDMTFGEHPKSHGSHPKSHGSHPKSHGSHPKSQRVTPEEPAGHT